MFRSSNNSKKLALGVIGKEPRRCGFVDEAEVDGLKSPSHIYNTDVKPIKPKLFGASIYKGTTGRSEVPQKLDAPSPGLYETSASFFKTQLRATGIKFDKTKKEGFFDEVERVSKNVPGVGHYKQTDVAYDKISRSPRTLKSIRK